jgi:4-hydroxy-2-oxoheptanedioate aldolase
MKLRAGIVVGLLLLMAGLSAKLPAADDELSNYNKNNLVSLLAAGKPAIGVWTRTINGPYIARVLATSDVDFIVADVEHDIYDFSALHAFLLEVLDFHLRYRTHPRPAPSVLVKLGHRGGWDPRYEIAETLRVGPAGGVWVPHVESRADAERIISTFNQSEQSAMEGLNLPGQGGHTHVSPLWPLNPKGQLMVVVMIETAEGVRNMKEIIETPGIAAVDTAHLSESEDAQVLKLCLERGVIAAISANQDNVKAKLAAGYKMISVGTEFRMLQRILDDTLKEMRSATAQKPGK